ncbi:MAG: hypothetical protein HQL07_00180 [Nitrospirae bacterium]|nr:hypothetical protein [Magnetococcales bacterium]HAT49646.1 hypothetical protein [Alphaproteobacteria bacterium]
MTPCRLGYVHKDLGGEFGGVLMTILIIITAMVGLIAFLFEHLLYVETMAVEESLARVRIYWAMSGQGNYFLSRLKWRVRELDETSVPSFSAVQTALGSFNFAQQDPDPTVCATTIDSSMIIRCIWDDVAPHTAQNIRPWDYGPGYLLPIRVSGGEKAGSILFSLAQGAVAGNGPLLQSKLIAGKGLQVSYALDGASGLSATVRLTQYQE